MASHPRPTRKSWALALGLLALSIPGGLRAQELPVGDGRVTDHPAVGNVFACRLEFRVGGASHDGPWFHGDHWNPAEKPIVAGNVLWPLARFTLTPDLGGLIFEGNGLPVEQPTGIFPITPRDPVYQYDANPNRIAAQDFRVTLPLEPVVAGEPSCLPMGMIGFTITGVALYNALDDAGLDAAAHEIQDLCNGHPQANSQYHYHNGSPCVPGADSDGLVGWALDGFPILGMRDGEGRLLTNADLDPCHGRPENLEIDGRRYGYAYHLTLEYPYILGCFSGELLDGTIDAVREGAAPRREPGPPPPPNPGRQPGV